MKRPHDEAAQRPNLTLLHISPVAIASAKSRAAVTLMQQKPKHGYVQYWNTVMYSIVYCNHECVAGVQYLVEVTVH